MPSATSGSTRVSTAPVAQTDARPIVALPFTVADRDPLADVEVLRWPSQAARRDVLADARQLRILVLDEEAPPLVVWDHREEWVRLPVSDVEIVHRADQLHDRVRQIDAGHGDEASFDVNHVVLPVVSGDGRARHRGRTVRLAPVGLVISAVLLHRLGELVALDDLHDRLRTVAPGLDSGDLGLEIRRVRRSMRTLGLHLDELDGTAIVLSDG